jgi:hypothetical protein
MDSSRIGLLGQGCVVVILAACAGCSSSSSPATPDSGGGMTTPPAGDGGADKVVVGDTTMPCKPTYPVATSVLVSLDVSWPATSATAKGTGHEYLSLLTVYSVDSNNKVTGTTIPCGLQAADVPLSDLGAMATGVPTGSMVRALFPAVSWDGVPPTKITGTVGGSNVGSSFEVDPSTSLVGIAPTDPLSDPTMKWPLSYSGIPMSDWTLVDGGPWTAASGEQPGITGEFYNGAMPFVLPRTSLSMTSPQVDHLHSVFRTTLSLYGTAATCMMTTGTATTTNINNHVVGCDIVNDGGQCTEAQYGFLDSNTTQYPPADGTFTAQQLTGGASATCADALTALPIPAPM